MMWAQFTPRMLISVIYCLVTLIYLFMVTLVTLPPTGAEFAKIIIPFLLSGVIAVIMNFYYGNKVADKLINPDSPIDETAKVEAAKIESDRIAAAKIEAEKAEQKRIDDAKVTAAEVITAAKTEGVPNVKKV